MSQLKTLREPFSKGEKLLFAALPVGVLLFGLSALAMRRGESVPRLNFPPPAPLPSPNGFDFYIAAAGAIKAAKPPVDPVDDVGASAILASPKLAAQNYSLGKRTAWLQSNRAGFALFQQGIRTPCRFDARSGASNYAKLRQLARSKVIEANTLILQKRWGAATTSSLDTIQMGYDTARGGPLIARLGGSAITAIGRNPLFTDQAVPEHLTAAQARAAARRLEAILAARPGLKEALVAGKQEALGEFLTLVKQGTWRNFAGQQAGQELMWRDKLRLQFLTPEQVVTRIGADFDLSIANLQKPYSAAIPPTPPPLDPVSGFFSYRSDYRFQEGREIVPFNTLLLRFALRAYRLENGAFPEKLEQLSPRYLKRIPRDYFASGAPFGYKKSGQNYNLWSVGPDKIDNGGAPMKNRNGTSGASVRGSFPPINQDVTGDYVAGRNR